MDLQATEANYPSAISANGAAVSESHREKK